MGYQGNLVSPSMQVVSLQESDSMASSWATFDLTIDYEFMKGDGFMDISGQAVLSEHYQMNYNSIRRLYVYFFLIDENSRVLESAILVRSLTGDVDEVMTFSHRYKVPAGATGFSFGYDGTAREMRTFTYFYKLPLKRKE
jgi:hypothetical protein